jgi:hypothetical protein
MGLKDYFFSKRKVKGASAAGEVDKVTSPIAEHLGAAAPGLPPSAGHAQAAAAPEGTASVGAAQDPPLDLSRTALGSVDYTQEGEGVGGGLAAEQSGGSGGGGGGGGAAADCGHPHALPQGEEPGGAQPEAGDVVDGSGGVEAACGAVGAGLGLDGGGGVGGGGAGGGGAGGAAPGADPPGSPTPLAAMAEIYLTEDDEHVDSMSVVSGEPACLLPLQHIDTRTCALALVNTPPCCCC